MQFTLLRFLSQTRKGSWKILEDDRIVTSSWIQPWFPRATYLGQEWHPLDQWACSCLKKNSFLEPSSSQLDSCLKLRPHLRTHKPDSFQDQSQLNSHTYTDAYTHTLHVLSFWGWQQWSLDQFPTPRWTTHQAWQTVTLGVYEPLRCLFRGQKPVRVSGLLTNVADQGSLLTWIFLRRSWLGWPLPNWPGSWGSQLTCFFSRFNL